MREVEGVAASRELLLVVGRACRVQPRRAEDALDGAGGIVIVGEEIEGRWAKLGAAKVL